ncbi:MAG: hypothetical protein AAFQ91_10705 [Cyanobacteria bacterium J06621_15]
MSQSKELCESQTDKVNKFSYVKGKRKYLKREHPKCVKISFVIASGTKWNDAFSEAADHRNTFRLLHFVCPNVLADTLR